jgi:hypothetical protein
MTKKEIKEANLLIGVFDGWVSLGLGGNYTHIYKRGNETKHVRNFEYHFDWNELMPVCKKWDSLIDFKENPKQWSRYSDLCDSLDHKVTLYEPEPIFIQLVECIKWYNEQFKKKKK